MRFVANLRQETIDAFSAEQIQPAAYLLSSHRITPATLRMASTIRGKNLPLFADNGTKPLIEQTVALFERRATTIQHEVRELRLRLGRVPRKSDISSELRRQAAKLADEVIRHATGISNEADPAELLDAQLSMKPTHLIAKEDFATACLIALDLEREFTGWPVSRWDARNRRTLKLWKAVAKDPRCKDVLVYAVLSAVDYDTARSAGRLAAQHGVRHAALGIAGINLDQSATDYFVIGRTTVEIDRPAPRRFIRLAQILRGVADGYEEVGTSLVSFHCLGLGAPAMLPIAAAAVGERTVLTADATSPIHDAVRDHVLYNFVEQGDRSTTVEIVKRLVEGKAWPLSSPFAEAFSARFGHHPRKARQVWIEQGQPSITKKLLRTPSGITVELPLLSMADPATIALASKVHIAHNHWVLGELCEAFPDKRGRHRAASSAMRAWIARQSSNSTTRGMTAAQQVFDAVDD
ncbi:hypothetical protein [Microvirga aerophila]|uniref:Uncharacterized protein n=1 Tax=Microvirga aerophila TaxID=670291 RepID=A0A512C2U4_9HYPH|nr:hypothetical protein [Microvirga aerophila]GEO18532.1 hypothetical protein MAE02_62280 [Microvirga aerophila]